MLFYIIVVMSIVLSGVAYVFFGVSQKTISLQKQPSHEEIKEGSEETDKLDERSRAKTSSVERDKKTENKESMESEKETHSKEKTISRLMKSGFDESKERSIDTIVIHSSYDALGDDPHSIRGVIKEYESYGVSAHYLIGRDGKIYQLVKDANVAWHAGKSKMPDGRTNVNQFSIGIELIYTKKETPGLDQYRALKELVGSLKNKYPIIHVVGHNQIAPDRKDDPWNFDWDNI